MADRARQTTDKMLEELERRIEQLYVSDPSLIRMQKKYYAYMDGVEKKTQDAYKAYVDETDREKKKELKKEYQDQVQELTLKNRQYKKLVSDISLAIAKVNEKALKLTNEFMDRIYILNYNQVSVECKKVGIEVNG